MDCTRKDLKKTYDIEQMAVIGKMHNMQWLKSNSQLPGHIKTLPVGKVFANNPLKSKINEEPTESITVVSTISVSNSFDLEKNDLIIDKNIDDSNTAISKIMFHPTLPVGFSENDSTESTWNKDINMASALFPTSQPMVTQRIDEQEKTSMNLPENIVTIQLEQFKLNDKESKPNMSYIEPNNEWSTAHHNSPDLVKLDNDVGSQVSPKQCHDNNNNDAKSKTQPTSEVKKDMQRTTTKFSAKKLSDQKIKKQMGSSLKEPSNVLKQVSKDKDDSMNSCSEDNKTSNSAADSKKISVGVTSKVIDKCGKVNVYSRQLSVGKGAQTKEQQFYKQHFSTLNDNGSKNKSSMEGLDEKNKFLTTKLKSPRNEPDKKGDEINETKKCHKVQLIRTQSYNIQYIRNKSLINSQQRYLRNSTKPEEENSIKNTSGFNNKISTLNSTENVSKKKCENQQVVISKQANDTQTSQSISGKNSDNANISECSTNEQNLVKSSLPNKRNYQNSSNARATTDRNVRDDQGYMQKFKKESNVYRRSSGILQSFPKDLNGKEKAGDHKKNVVDNNSSRDCKINRVCSVGAKVYSQSEGSKITIYPNKGNGASNVNKTDTSDSANLNNVQSPKSLNSCSTSTKDSTTINTSTHTSQESQILQASYNGTEVQFVKTEQDASNNNSNNNTSANNSETKSVKFSNNVQEMNAVHSTTSYTDNSIQQNAASTNPFYSDLQNPFNVTNAQEIENHRSVQNKSYFHNNNAQYNNTSVNIQNSEKDLYLLDGVQQKSEQTSHISPQNISPHSNCNPSISIGNSLPYQNVSTVYLNQYSNAQTVPRKTTDSTIFSHNGLIPSTSYAMESQNIMQSEPSNILMHNTQSSVLPPPGFHNHPVTSQHNQWNLPAPDMLLYGNVMNSAHPLNMQIQNSRHVCSTDYNNILQTGYLHHPLLYVPPVCMQSWNPLLQYSTPLFQNPPYTNCNTFSNQGLQSNTLSDCINCPIVTSAQDNPYKQFQQMQQLENNPNFSVPVKLENYMGNMQQGCKTNNVSLKDNVMDLHMRSNRYRSPMANEYQNCTQDGQVMVPFSYAVTMDSTGRNGPSNMHMQVNQKYGPYAATAANYQRMPESCSPFQNNQEYNNRKDDVLRNDSECIPPMVSPRDCMYYGINYSRKTDSIQNSSGRIDPKSMVYLHSVNSQHYAPQYYKNAIYHHSSPKDLTSRGTVSRGTRKTMEQ
ncbi:uncharacterized protein DDB_G0283357-like isoform X1 [Hylaeus volcanicus]|uniref:uncharacterized protein DDB_G0283357-like isoform X1 n=2 Tax=Hylaeus volcanicus TaxID=313075 RepID=UPI0023B7F8E8|nr:uncharacterized protein DDB_G0283357-like isoform X1 [Hylaeus volcanicus]